MAAASEHWTELTATYLARVRSKVLQVGNHPRVPGGILLLHGLHHCCSVLAVKRGVFTGQLRVPAESWISCNINIWSCVVGVWWSVVPAPLRLFAHTG